ncbi:hypothetical protein Tco_0972607 [Tanacetum coccineum]
MWASLGSSGSVGVVNAVRCVFADPLKHVGLQVALRASTPAPAPATIPSEAARRGENDNRGGDLELGGRNVIRAFGENVNRSGDLELGGQNVIRAVGEDVIRGGVFELGGRNVIHSLTLKNT